MLVADGSPKLLGHCAVEAQRVDLMLSELGHVDVCADFHRPCHWLEPAEQQVQQRCFASTVWPDERQLLASLDHKVDVAQHGDAVEANRGVLDLHDDSSRSLRLRECEFRFEFRWSRNLNALKLLEGLDPTLHLASLGRFVSEPLNKPLGVINLSLLTSGGGSGTRQPVFSLDYELSEAAHVLSRNTVDDLNNSVGHVVDEVTVVTDKEQRPRPLLQPLL
jgi:hypothetical protein